MKAERKCDAYMVILEVDKMDRKQVREAHEKKRAMKKELKLKTYFSPTPEGKKEADEAARIITEQTGFKWKSAETIFL